MALHTQIKIKGVPKYSTPTPTNKKEKKMNYDYPMLTTTSDDTIMVAGSVVNLHHYIQIKRMNHLLNTEVGIMLNISDLRVAECYQIIAKIVIEKLKTRMPINTLDELLGTYWQNFNDYKGDSIHQHFGRDLIDYSWDLPTQTSFDAYAFVNINILNKILQEDDAIEPFILILQESLYNLFIHQPFKDADDLLATFGIEQPTYKDNVVSIASPTTLKQ